MWTLALSNDNYLSLSSFREWLAYLFSKKNQDEADLLCVCAWQIWNARNDFCFEKVSVSPELVFKRASDLLMEFKKANDDIRKVHDRRTSSKWCPPVQQVIKINVDAAVNAKDDRIGLGVVARNYCGTVLLAGSKTFWPFIFVEIAELNAFLWAVELAKERGGSNIIFEGDAINVVKALQGSLTRGFHSQVFIRNILSEAAHLDRSMFQFCFREANSVAHRLARWALASFYSNVWLDGGPT